MNIIAVDDKPVPRRALARAIEAADPCAQITLCANADEVLGLPDLDDYDVAFIDIDMPGKNGIELARELKVRHPKLNVIFATGYGEYMADAFALHSSGYLMKPITPQKVASELENLRFPPEHPLVSDKLVVRCFGNFEVFAHGEPLAFGRTKAKELLAYLVDRRGALCTIAEIEALLWEDQAGKSSQRSYIRTLIATLRTTLEEAGFPDVMVKRRGAVGIRTDAIDCDFYAFLAGDPMAIASYRGEYMRQYSWAEVTLARLNR